MGATNTLERVAASVGLLSEAPARFERVDGVSNGGVLLAMPALLQSGLLRHAKHFFSLPKGFYGLTSVFVLLGFMALARLRSVESLRYVAPGEWGKLLGLDRIPEVRTLRSKLNKLTSQNVEGWSAELAREWMQQDPEAEGVFYVDGHVRVYYGSQTQLPRHYVSRQRLCQRATTDYWVNAMDGQPFFYVTKEIDPGLVKVLEEDIVPRLESVIAPLDGGKAYSRPLSSPRCTLVFDREGYSPGFLGRTCQRNIACITYHKHPKGDWTAEEFKPHTVELHSGERVEMDLAERGVLVGTAKVWMREIRKLTTSGKQVSVLTTHAGHPAPQIASWIFARWSQENFFRYMRQHYGLDRLLDYCVEDIPDTTRVVNPVYRDLDGKVRKTLGKLNRKMAEFGQLQLHDTIEPKNVEAYERGKAQIQQEIDELTQSANELKTQRRSTARHIEFKDLPEEHRFKRLGQTSKHFVDTIKMIAYRAETAMAGILRENLARSVDVRALLQALYQNEADLIPDTDNKTLTVRIHHLANRAESDALAKLCDTISETMTTFPGTELRMIFKMGSSQTPRDQEV